MIAERACAEPFAAAGALISGVAGYSRSMMTSVMRSVVENSAPGGTRSAVRWPSFSARSTAALTAAASSARPNAPNHQTRLAQ